VKHFGAIDGLGKCTRTGAARYEAEIWRNRKIAIGFSFYPGVFLENAFRPRRIFKASDKRAAAPGIEIGMALIRRALAD
jgi:hypothetical protein